MECTKCKVDKPVLEFHKKSLSPTGYNYHCRECINTYRRNTFSASRKEYMRSFYLKKATKHKTKLIEMFGGKCNECGLVDEPCVYDFHHLDASKKEFNVASMLLHKTWDAIVREVANCIMLCSNCHRKLHYKRIK